MSKTFELSFNLAGKVNKTLKSSMNSFKGDVQDLNKKIADLEQSRGKSKRFQGLRKEIIETNREYSLAQQKVNDLAKEISKAKQPTKALQQEFERSKRNASGLKDKLTEQKEELRGLKTSLDSAGISTKNFGKDQQALEKKLNNTINLQQKISKNEIALENAKAKTSKARSELTRAIAPALTLGIPIKIAMDAEETMADINKVADFKTEAEIKAMEKKIMDMNTKGKIPMSFNELGAIVASGAQAGIKNIELPRFASDAAKMGIAFDIEAEDAGETMANWRSAFRMNQDEVIKLANKVNYLGNTTSAAAPDITNFVTRVGAMGEVGGVQSGPIAAIGATLIGMGRGAEESATSVNKMISALNKGSSATDRQKKALQKLGFGATEMAKRMQTDAQGAIIDVLKSIRKLDKYKQSAVINDLFGSSGEKAISPLILSLEQLEQNFDKVDEKSNLFSESMEKEFQSRISTSANSAQIMKNNLQNIAITFGNVVLPAVVEITGSLSSLMSKVQDFSDKHPKLTKGLVTAGASMLGLNIAMKLGNFATASISEKFLSLSSNAFKLATATNAQATATALSGKSLKIMGLAAKSSLASIGPWAIGIGAVGAGAYGLYKYVNKKAIPEIKLFDSTISESTKDSINSFMELDKKASNSLKQLSWNGWEVTKELSTSISNKFNDMSNKLTSTLEEQKNESISNLEETLSLSTSLTEEEKSKALQITAEHFDEQALSIQEGNNRIQEILKQASEEKRLLTEEENTEITNIKEQMQEDAIRILSESEAEQMAILERFKLERDNMDAEEAAAFAERSAQKRDQTIASAEEAYESSLASIAALRAEGGEEAEELANKLAKEAQEAKDEAVAKAQEMHESIVNHAKEQAQEHVDKIDWETGQIKTKWTQFIEWLSANKATAQFETTGYNSSKFTPNTGGYKGYAKGGIVNKPELAWVGEGNSAEAIIPLERTANSLALWNQAGKALGADSGIAGLAKSNSNSGNSNSTITGGERHYHFNIDASNNNDGESIKSSIMDILPNIISAIESKESDKIRLSIE